MLENRNIKVALVHDFLTQYGGAERVLEVLSEMFPEAPIYTLLYDEQSMHGKFFGRDIRTSFLQKFPSFLRKKPKYLLPFLATAPETFDLRDFDLVISSSGAWSKGIITRLKTVHFCYMHSPMRFAWDVNEEYLKSQKRGIISNFLARLSLSYIRLWDYLAADRPDYIIANSFYTQRRIKKYYGRESIVIYPPVNQADQKDLVEIREKGNYFLVVSRLSAYKNIGPVVEAFNKLGLPLVVVGEGEQKGYLKKIAAKNVKIIGWQEEDKLKKLYLQARGFIFASCDDFGIAAVEAMSFGIPVIALGQGGIKEIVIEGQTGEFFNAPTAEVIADGVRRFMEKENGYDKNFLRQRAEYFSKEKFKKELQEIIDAKK